MTDRDIAQALAEQVRDAAERRQPLRLIGLDSKGFYGHAVDGQSLQLGGHSGITSYEPTELVMTARAGTPVAEIEAALAANGQMLAFEPPEFTGTASIGGAVASGLGGPRRPWGGAPRDLLLGMTLLDGQGRILRFGGEVMKNVAGYDLSRLMAGALGTLGALLEVSIKVLPAPAVERNLVLHLSRDRALQLMRELARQPAPLSGACHLDDQLHLRLSGNAASVATWQKQIGGEAGDGDDFWHQLRHHGLVFFESERPLWRLSLPPATPRLDCEQHSLTDWAGAQRWIYSSCGAMEIRDEVAKIGGHAILFRHGDGKTPVFHPLDSVRERLHRGLKKTFDPHGILTPVANTLRFSSLAILCTTLFLPQTANAFLCLMLGSGNKSHARSVPYPVRGLAPPPYRLPPIMGYRPAAPQQRSLPPRPPSRTLQWRPVDYRTGSR